MAIYDISSGRICPLPATTFAMEQVRERQDLQRMLKARIEVIDPDLLVIAEEFGEWEDGRRRIDLLAVDRAANLVVIELKRTTDGGHMELQALRYAAMISTMTFERAVTVYADFLTREGRDLDARDSLLSFLEWDEPNENQFGQDVRIVLVSADFSKEITTAVLWLNERDLDIRCVRMLPYRDGARTLLDVQQVIPLPEASDFQVQVREKQQRRREGRWQQKDMPTIWREFRKRCSPEIVRIAENLFQWLESTADSIVPTADAFAPFLANKPRNHCLFKVSWAGEVEIWFNWLQRREPFSDPALREELRRRLNAISGVRIDANRIGGKPKFPLEALNRSESMKAFQDTVTWAFGIMRDRAV